MILGWIIHEPILSPLEDYEIFLSFCMHVWFSHKLIDLSKHYVRTNLEKSIHNQ